MQRWTGRWEILAPLVLVISTAVRLAVTYLDYSHFFVDLHVYVIGGAALDEPGKLYDFVYADQSPHQPLPFTYPPFAAIMFYPLHLLGFGVVAFCWQLGIVAALYGSIRISQRLLGGGSREVAMLWTALTMWIEPLRNTFDFGQVGVFLMLAVLYAVYTSRWWLSGLLIGVAAGMKLTPAISALYFLGVRRWGAAVFSAVVFLATVGLSVLVVGDQARYYFTEVLAETGRINPVGTVFNQSWSGGLARIMGHDPPGFGPLVVAIAVTAVLAVLAWRALGTSAEDRDRLGSLLVIQLVGLLLSPISWTHHWVWVVPLMIWLIHGPWREMPGARILGWGWLAVTLIGVPKLLSFAQPSVWQIGRPWYLAWAGLVFIAATLVTFGWIAATGRRARRPNPSLPHPHPLSRTRNA